MKTKHVTLENLVADTSLQVRKEINGWVVSRLVQVLKSGNEFEDPIAILPDNRILAGFHRFQAYKRVKDPQEKIKVQVYQAKDEQDAYLFAVKSNLTHGQPLEEFEKKAIRRKLQGSGWTDEQISLFIGVSLDRLYKWDAERVVVQSGSKTEQMDTKPGTRLPKKLSKEQYAEHINHHAVSTVFHARKIIGRIKDGTIEDDERTTEVLGELYACLQDALGEAAV